MGAYNIIRHSLRNTRLRKGPIEEVYSVQRKRLEAVVRHAATHSPYYRELYKGIDLEDFRLEDLPIVTKQDLMNNFEEVLTDREIRYDDVRRFLEEPDNIGKLFKGRTIAVHTSGTTGQKAYFLYDIPSWEITQGLLITLEGLVRPTWRDYAMIFVRPFRRAAMAAMVPNDGPFITVALERITPWLKNLFFTTEEISILDPLDGMVERLNTIRPRILHGYPTQIELLAHEKIEGRLQIHPRGISVSSEPLTEKARRTIREAFPKSELVNTYGTTEAVLMGRQCLEGRMHLNADWVIIEPVDRENRPVSPGELSHHILVTNLGMFLQPIIRYEVSDSIIPLREEEPCPCGICLPTARVIGRTDDAFWVEKSPGEYTPLLPMPLEILMLGLRGIRQYQLIQEGRDLIHVRYSAKPDTPPLDQKIINRFRSYFASQGINGAVRFRIDRVDRIERDPSTGKIRQISSRVPPPIRSPKGIGL